MKQNERLLVYAVTGFLAVILVIAVVFGPSGRAVLGATKPVGTPASAEPASGPVAKDGAKGLGELLGQTGDAAGNTQGDANAPGNVAEGSGIDALPAPNELTRQQPLVAVDPAVLTADLLAQQLGSSHRDRSVRMVRARAGDSLETLVRRWCGARDPFLDEAKALNEDLTVLRVGQEICVPWVDDAVVLAAVEASEARQPKTLMAAASGGGSIPGVGSLQSVLGGGPAPAGSPADGVNIRAGGGAADPRPSFAQPGRLPAGGAAPDAPATTRRAAEYTVKSGDSLWKIADRTYGRQLAARMVGLIKEANPGVDEQRLAVGQKLVLPQAP